MEEKSIDNSPPKFSTLFLSKVLPKNLQDPILGDLFEEFQQRNSLYGKADANTWYRHQAIKTGLQLMFKGNKKMIKNIKKKCMSVALVMVTLIGLFYANMEEYQKVRVAEHVKLMVSD